MRKSNIENILEIVAEWGTHVEPIYPQDSLLMGYIKGILIPYFKTGVLGESLPKVLASFVNGRRGGIISDLTLHQEPKQVTKRNLLVHIPKKGTPTLYIHKTEGVWGTLMQEWGANKGYAKCIRAFSYPHSVNLDGDMGLRLYVLAVGVAHLHRLDPDGEDTAYMTALLVMVSNISVTEFREAESVVTDILETYLPTPKYSVELRISLLQVATDLFTTNKVFKD